MRNKNAFPREGAFSDESESQNSLDTYDSLPAGAEIPEGAVGKVSRDIHDWYEYRKKTFIVNHSTGVSDEPRNSTLCSVRVC